MPGGGDKQDAWGGDKQDDLLGVVQVRWPFGGHKQESIWGRATGFLF